MTHDRTKIEAGLDAMRAAGGTNIMEGIAWGMRAISRGEPYNTVDSSPLGPGTLISNYNDVKWQKIIVLMSDGENDPGLSSSSANIDIGRSYNAYGRSTIADGHWSQSVWHNRQQRGDIAGCDGRRHSENLHRPQEQRGSNLLDRLQVGQRVAEVLCNRRRSALL